MSRIAFQSDSCVVAEVKPSPNFGERKDGRRPDMIILHYTGMLDGNAALERLAARDSEVSAHYVVFEDGKSFWAGETDINSSSIGIEIVNPGHDYGYPDFPKRQIAAVTALCRSIQTRNTIPPERVLGHSDVAPSRKQDPGEKFPWRTLYDSGVGQWVRPAPITEGGLLLTLGDRGEAVTAMQRALAEYGYGLPINGDYDSATQQAVLAFQRHFRPERVDGLGDSSTRETLKNLLARRGGPRTMAARARDFGRLAS
jgi:N-acetylmuramoyl-L-alanine amidase